MSELQMLTELDVLIATRNDFLDHKISSELKVEFYRNKLKNLKNGDNSKAAKDNLELARRNVEDNSFYLSLVEKRISNLKGASNS